MALKGYWALGLAICMSVAATANDLRSITLDEYQGRKVVIVVPPGNRNVQMPAVPASSNPIKRLVEDNSATQILIKHRNVAATLRRLNMQQIVPRVAERFGLPPELVLGALWGEHVFNTPLLASAQDYAAMAARWVKRQADGDYLVLRLLSFNEFSRCHQLQWQFQRWDCVVEVWQSRFRGRNMYQQQWADRPFFLEFFNPYLVGTTYGVGQVGPLSALRVTDIVNRFAPELPAMDLRTPEDMDEVYKTILSPEKVVHYVAAMVWLSVESYKTVANFDIRGNPGVVATLYNLGGEYRRATELYRGNVNRLRGGQMAIYPEENFYGWWINDRIEDLREFLRGG
jgi:hypothetical protein